MQFLSNVRWPVERLQNALATGQQYRRPVDNFQNFRRPVDRFQSISATGRLESIFQSPFNLDSDFEQDSSYVSAFMTKRSLYKACSLRKLGLRPSYATDIKEIILFLHRIQRDICRLIHSYCGFLRYFMILVDASTYWSHVVLLSTHNAAYAKLLAHFISLRAHHPDHSIMSNMSWQC